MTMKILKKTAAALSIAACAALFAGCEGSSHDDDVKNDPSAPLAWKKAPPATMTVGQEADLAVINFANEATIKWTAANPDGLCFEKYGSAVMGDDDVDVIAKKTSGSSGWAVTVTDTATGQKLTCKIKVVAK